MNTGSWIRLAALCGLIGTACGPAAVSRDVTANIQTDSLRYHISRTADTVKTGWLHYTIVNRTSDPRYIVYCRDLEMSLERLDGSKWVSAWTPPYATCLGSPIVVDPQLPHRDSIRVLGVIRNVAGLSRFEGPLHGTFRLVLHHMLSSFNPRSRSEFGPEVPLEQRVSNPFVLR